MGLRTRARLEAMTFATDDLEWLAGRIAPSGTDFSPECVDTARGYLAAFTWPEGQTGHCALELEPVFRMGLGALGADICQRLAATSGQSADTLASFRDALYGLSSMIGNARTAAEAAAIGALEWRRTELAELAASCARIASAPPQTFRDAIQLLWLINTGVAYADHASLVSPGRLDQVLRPFYDADMASGTLTKAHALSLLESLYLLINNFVPDGLAIAVMVGGTDADGADMTHPLSFLCLEALRRTRLIYPTVGVCWHAKTPPSLTLRACELIAAGYATPAFFNDAVIRSGLEHYGVPRSDSHAYINSTCVEITPVGCSNVWVASPYYSLCAILLEEIAHQATSHTPTATFDAFWNAYRVRLATAVDAGAAKQRRCRESRRQHGGKPLQSVFTRDCISRSLDIDAGGARVNWVTCSFVGAANLADALQVIRTELYERQHMSFADLKRILDANYEGAEARRLAFLNAHPKYGNADPAVDALVARLATAIRDACGSQAMPPDNSAYIPGMFCWIMHERLGTQCGATPDGRKAGEPFADGGGPAQGREHNGPTRAILSTTSWDHAFLIGGLAYNMKFSSDLFATPDAVVRLSDLVVTFLKRGGFETQINVTSRALLDAAEKHPERHRDLIVRIGGYTDYFVRLSPEMRNEVRRRTEYTNV